MGCETVCRTRNYGKGLFCRVCGMDVELDFIIKKGNVYCCKECEKNGRKQ